MAKCREERSSRRPPIKPLAQYLVVFVRGSILRNAVWPSAQNHMFAGMTHSGPNDLCVSHVSHPGFLAWQAISYLPSAPSVQNSVVLGNTIDIAVSGAQRMRGFASKIVAQYPKESGKAAAQWLFTAPLYKTCCPKPPRTSRKRVCRETPSARQRKTSPNVTGSARQARRRRPGVRRRGTPGRKTSSTRNYLTVSTGTSTERSTPKLTLPIMPRSAPRPRRPMTTRSMSWLFT